jgi:hypothetical protein
VAFGEVYIRTIKAATQIERRGRRFEVASCYVILWRVAASIGNGLTTVDEAA